MGRHRGGSDNHRRGHCRRVLHHDDYRGPSWRLQSIAAEPTTKSTRHVSASAAAASAASSTASASSAAPADDDQRAANVDRSAHHALHASSDSCAEDHRIRHHDTDQAHDIVKAHDIVQAHGTDHGTHHGPDGVTRCLKQRKPGDDPPKWTGIRFSVPSANR